MVKKFHYRLCIEYVNGPFRGMKTTSITTKRFKINRLVKQKKASSYRVLSVEKL
jgi:hypothetical protein